MNFPPWLENATHEKGLEPPSPVRKCVWQLSLTLYITTTQPAMYANSSPIPLHASPLGVDVVKPITRSNSSCRNYIWTDIKHLQKQASNQVCRHAEFCQIFQKLNKKPNAECIVRLTAMGTSYRDEDGPRTIIFAHRLQISLSSKSSKCGYSANRSTTIQLPRFSPD